MPKVVTKSAQKKASAGAKRVRTPKPAMVVHDDQAFWTVDGQVFRSLGDLCEGLKTMERRVYLYHADAAHQDFAVWTKVVLGDAKAAQLLKKAATQKDAYKVLTQHCKSISG